MACYRASPVQESSERLVYLVLGIRSDGVCKCYACMRLCRVVFAVQAARDDQEASREVQESTMCMPTQLLRGEHFTCCPNMNTVTYAYYLEILCLCAPLISSDQET